MDDKLYYIWLQRICGAANRLSGLLLSHFPSAAAVYECTDFSFLPENYRHYADMLCVKDLSQALETYKACVNRGIKLVPYHSPDYPASLRDIDDPPVQLYVYGDITRLSGVHSAAIVGTRNADENGIASATRYAESFARSGVAVISGLAKGIDCAANDSALKAGGLSVGVLGTPIDRIYPPENVRLFHRMYSSGVVVSEYAPRAEVGRYSFPARNRIISALSECTVVIQAAQGSGAIITARRAVQQNKPVYFAAGGVTAVLEGSVSVSCPAEVLERFEIDDPSLRISPSAYAPRRAVSHGMKIELPPEKNASQPGTNDELKLLSIISGHPGTAEEFAAEMKVSVDRIYELLTLLELDGAITASAGGRYMKNTLK